MSKITQKVELIANILIIFVALTIGSVLIKKYFFPQTVISNQQRMEIEKGTKISLPDVNWSQQSKTLILVLQTDCHFCNESIPFYKRLLQSIPNKDLKIMAVFPTSVEKSRLHLEEFGINNIEVKQSSLSSLKVVGTPTLILINKNGDVIDSWVGKLSIDDETEVINEVNL
jgi:thioredoxin-related protein